MKRIMIFIDGNNFESAVGREYRLDYPRLARTIADRRGGIFQRLYFYTAMAKKIPAYEKQVEQVQRFIHALQSHEQVIVRVGNLISIGKDEEGKDILTEKGTDVQLAVDLVSLAFTNAYDEAVLLSADTDYLPAIELVRQIGKNVVIGVVEHQKASMIKQHCDAVITFTIDELSRLQR